MSDPFQTVVEALERAGCNPKPSHVGVTAVCPAHEDRSPSLGVSTGADGRVLIHCRAACQTASVIAALGLHWRDLFPANGRGRGSGRSVGRATRFADEVLMFLRARGIGYRATENPHMWVADCCPACGMGRLPVLIFEDERKRITVSCAEGCDQGAVLLALTVGRRAA